MSRKRPLQEEVVLTGEESDAINQISKEYTARNPKLVRNVSLSPFQLSFCDEPKAATIINSCSNVVIQVNTTNFDTTPEMCNRFQLLTFTIGSKTPPLLGIPLLFLLCGSSAEEIISACSLAIRKIKTWLVPEKLACVFGPPELRNTFQEQFSKNLPYNLSFTEVFSTDSKWMQKHFPEHSNNLQTSLKLLFHNKEKSLEEFLHYWSRFCPSYAEDFVQNWNPSTNPIDRSHFEIDSVASTFLRQLHQKHGDPIVNISFSSLIATLRSSLEHWYFYWDTQQQISASLSDKKAVANFKNPIQPDLPPLAPSVPSPAPQQQQEEPSLDDSFVEEPIASPTKVQRISCQNCYHQRHAKCSHGLCKVCCKQLRCKEPTHMEPPKLKILLAKEIKDINDAMKLKKPLQVKYQHERNVIVLHEVVWKKQLESFTARQHTEIHVYKLMHVLGTYVVRAKPEKE